MTLGMRYEELPGMPLGMRWEELAGKRCANLIVPRISVFSCGARCTKFFDPGVPVFSCGAHCTTFFPERVEAKGFGKAMTLRGFLGFVAPIVV